MRCMKRHGLIFGTLALLIAGTAQPSFAFKGIDDAPSLSYKLSKPKDEVYKDMELHQEMPQNDTALALRVKLPKGWLKYDDKGNVDDIAGVTAEGGQEGTDIFKTLLRYVSPPRLEWRSEFRVRSIEINTLISLQNWFSLYMLQMGFSPEGVSRISNNRMDSQYTLFEKGEPMVVRAVIQKSGNKIILAEYLVHQDNYEAEKDEQVAAMADYGLLSPDTSSPIALNVYTFVDIAKFNYPASWLLYTPDVDTIDRMEASVINVRGEIPVDRKNLQDHQLNGRIDVAMVSKFISTTVEKEVAEIGANLKEKGLTLGEKIADIKDQKVHNLVTSVEIKVYNIAPPESELVRYRHFSGENLTNKKLAGYEYWFAILETKGRYYFIRLLTISRDEDFKAWSENTEVLKMLLESVSPVNDTAH